MPRVCWLIADHNPPASRRSFDIGARRHSIPAHGSRHHAAAIHSGNASSLDLVGTSFARQARAARSRLHMGHDDVLGVLSHV
jgi:hypothetical protein